MTYRGSIAALFATVGAAMILAPAAGADGRAGAAGDVFVQTNQSSGNEIVVYDASSDGRLSRVAAYPTGGNGGTALPGSESDHLGSQGSLAYDPGGRLLIAVNAGSDSVTTFTVTGDRLRRTGIVDSGGQFPASVAVHDRLVYVLNSGGTGTVQGYRITGKSLVPIPGSARTLGLANSDPPFFLNSPGQVGFTPDGRQLLVTTKASGNNIDVFAVRPDGRLSATPVKNPAANPVPFAFTFTPVGRLADGEAGTSSVTTYKLERGGTLTDPKSQSDGQTALCWILKVNDVYYVSNTGSNTLSAYRISSDGQPSLLTPSGVVATTDPGPIDLTSPSGNRFLYADTGNGPVDEFSINHDGTLTPIGSVTGLPPGIEGIAST